MKKPNTGWYAKKANAKFSLKITSTLKTRYMTLVTMKSYGPTFLDAMLRVSVRIQRNKQQQRTESSTTAAATKDYEISGYHEAKTSVHVPHKFQLPGEGADNGDVILLDVELVRGSNFKVSGIAFCGY